MHPRQNRSKRRAKGVGKFPRHSKLTIAAALPPGKKTLSSVVTRSKSTSLISKKNADDNWNHDDLSPSHPSHVTEIKSIHSSENIDDNESPEKIHIWDKVADKKKTKDDRHFQANKKRNKVKDEENCKYKHGRWDQRFNELKRYKQSHNHCNVPRSHPSLGLWVADQRVHYNKLKSGDKKAKITVERIRALESIGFVWRLRPLRPRLSWNDRFLRLKQFYKENGHCHVRQSDELLGHWTHNQRSYYKLFIEGKPSSMNQARVDALESIGFEWNITRQWSVSHSVNMGESSETPGPISCENRRHANKTETDGDGKSILKLLPVKRKRSEDMKGEKESSGGEKIDRLEAPFHQETLDISINNRDQPQRCSKTAFKEKQVAHSADKQGLEPAESLVQPLNLSNHFSQSIQSERNAHEQSHGMLYGLDDVPAHSSVDIAFTNERRGGNINDKSSVSGAIARTGESINGDGLAACSATDANTDQLAAFNTIELKEKILLETLMNLRKDSIVSL